MIDNALVLTLLRYADELVDTSQLAFPAGEKCGRPSSTWRGCSSTTWPSEWDPSKYTDEYRDNLMKLIKARIKGREAAAACAGRAPVQARSST